jgi:hypothetical protein
MRRTFLVLPVLALAIFIVPITRAFFNEVDELKQELVTWQTTHAADFSDLINTLENLSTVSFSDVSAGDWFSPYVASVNDWGIVSGYRDATGKPTGIFGPSNSVTVAELLKMALEAAQVDKSQCGLVPPTHAQAIGHWAAQYVSCAEAKNMRIMQNPNIDINRLATRAEVVEVIDDAFGDTVPPIYSNFKDTAGHPLEADIAYAYLRGIISGDKDSHGVELGIFRPNDAINRAEVAKIIYERLKVDVKTGQ